MSNINKNIIMQAGAAIANATNKAAGLTAATPEPGSIISVIQLVNGGRTIGPDALAHFTESVRNKLLSLLVSMNPIQSGSGTPSPDNVRPISGRTGLSVYVSPTSDVADATTYSVDWTSQAGTVYGGTLDLVTGVLTVTHAYIEYDGSSDESWVIYSAPRFYINRADFTSPGNLVVADIKTNRLQVISKTAMGSTNYRFSASDSGSHQFMIRIDPSVNTVSLLRTWLSNNPMQVVYKLTTPLTYQLTGTDIVTLVGDNYIWSDSGDVTITE